MKVAVLCESPVDECAVRILVDGLLDRATQPIDPPSLRTRGWPSVVNVLPFVLKHLYYQTDAEAFVVVVDSDGSAVHDPSHKEADAPVEGCRLCRLRAVISQTQGGLKPVTGRAELYTAVGLASPCIEAWYRCGLDASCTEAAWKRERAQNGKGREKRLQLKRDVYGSDRCPVELMKQHAIEQARRLVRGFPQLERQFPGGFGALARDIRAWKTTDGIPDV